MTPPRQYRPLISDPRGRRRRGPTEWVTFVAVGYALTVLAAQVLRALWTWQAGRVLILSGIGVFAFSAALALVAGALIEDGSRAQVRRRIRR